MWNKIITIQKEQYFNPPPRVTIKRLTHRKYPDRKIGEFADAGSGNRNQTHDLLHAYADA